MAGGPSVAVLRSGGIPIGFLPRRDARTLFEGFRTLLRAHGHGLLLCADARPVDPAPLLPGGRAELPTAEQLALAGYREMLEVLLRRRRTRSVLVVTWSVPGEPDALERLEERVQALTGGLIALGLVAERLEGRSLGAALTEIGYRGGLG